MGNVSSNFPTTMDALSEGAWDASVSVAVQNIEQWVGGYIGPTLSNVFAQTISDEIASSSVTATAGSVVLSLIQLRAGATVNKISFITAVTAASTPTHSWAFIASTATQPLCLAVSADSLTAAIAADALQTYTLATPYPVTTSGLYYVGFCVAGTTGPTVTAAVTLGSHGRGNVTPYTSGIGDTGKTAPYAVAGNVTAPSSSLAAPLIYLS